MANALLTSTSPTDSLNASIWGKNLLNEHLTAGAELGSGLSGGGVYPIPPRTYGVTLGVKF